MLCRIVFKTRSPVELLLAGVPIERVSVLLGPSNRPHHRETLQPPGTLAARAARAWERDPLLQSPAQVTAVQKNTGYKTGTGQLAGVTSL